MYTCIAEGKKITESVSEVAITWVWSIGRSQDFKRRTTEHSHNGNSVAERGPSEHLSTRKRGVLEWSVG